MNVSELRCTNCIAPIDPSYGQVQRCPYCGTTLMIGKDPVVGMSHPGHPAAPTVVFLESSGANKISVIKTIREHTGLGLKEAKDLCDAAPCVVAEWDDKERMDRFRKALTDAGARVR